MYIFEFLFKLFIKLQIVVFRLSKGKAMGAMRGMPVLLLTTVGRKSGKQRTTPLMYIRDGDSYVVTASNNGNDRHPAWLYNLQVTPQVQIEVPGQRLEVQAEVATQAEQERRWPQLEAEAPFFDKYRQKTTRAIPMVLLNPR